MAFRYGRADIRSAAFDRPPLVDPNRSGRRHDFDLERARPERDERRRPRSRSRSPPPRYERRRSPERERAREFDRERRSPFRDRRSPQRDRRDRIERPIMDRSRDRDVRDPRRPSPLGDRLDRIDRFRDQERLPHASGYTGFSAPPPAYSGRSTGFSSAPPFAGNGAAPPAAVDRCYVCGGIGHLGRNCPSNPQEVAKLRPPPLRREGPIGVPIPPPGRGRGMPPDDPELPKCFECGKRGHVARECRFKQGGGPIEQRCYNCGSVGHIARECPRPPESRPPPRAISGPGHLSGPPPRAILEPSGDVCYNCGRPGHFARECPAKFGPPNLGPSPMDRWLGGMPGPGPVPRGVGFGGVGLGLGFGGMGGGGAPPPAGDGCYECGQLGHFARECPARSHKLAERAAAAAGAGGAGEGRRIASKASTGGRAEEAKLNYELEDYMKERASHRKDGEEDDDDRKLEEGDDLVAMEEDVGPEDAGAGDAGTGEGGEDEGGLEEVGEQDIAEDEGVGEERDIEVEVEAVEEEGGEAPEKAEDEPEKGGEAVGGEGGTEEQGNEQPLEAEVVRLPNLNDTAPDTEGNVVEAAVEAESVEKVEAGERLVDLNGEPQATLEDQTEQQDEEGAQEELDVDG